MKKHLITLLVFGLAFYLPQVNAITTSKENQSGGILNTLINAVQDLQSYQKELVTKTVSLEFEKNFEPSLEKIEKINLEISTKESLYQEIEQKIKELKVEIKSKANVSIKNVLELELENEQRNFDKIKKSIFDSQNEKTELQENFDARKIKQEETIKTLKQEIQILEEEILKQKTLIRTQINNLLTNLVIFSIIVIFLLFLRFFSSKIIIHLTQNLTVARQKALISISRITFNILVGIVILGIISSQFVNILPFLAIFSTGLAWALRDPVSSFMAWFIIGSERGYKQGHIVKLDQTYGKVVEIGPLLTVIQEFDQDESTGKLISVPNNFIFEKPTINYSRSYGFVLDELIFTINSESDLHKSEEIMKKILNETIQKFHKNESIKNLSHKFAHNFKLTEQEMSPKVWIKTIEQKLLLTCRYYIQMTKRDQFKQEVTKQFLQTIKNNKDIKI